MSAKKSGLPFEAYPSPKTAENGEKILYVKPQSGLQSTLAELENWCKERHALHPGDMARVFTAMLDSAPHLLAKGQRIETPIGTFVARLRLKRQETNPDHIGHDDVELDGVEFQPTKAFVRNVLRCIGMDGFRYVRRPQSSRIMENVTRLDQALHRCMKEQGYATVAQFAAYSGLTDHSARKQLNKWCQGDSPRLQMTRFGRIHIYTET